MITKLFETDDCINNRKIISNTQNNKKIISYFRYGKGFGLFPKDSMFNIPNPIYGLAFYIQFAILSMYSIILAYACYVTFM